MRMRTWAAALAAGSLLLGGCSGDDPKPSSEPAPAAVTAGPDSDHLLIHGTVYRGDKPVAGAQLALTLFPEDGSDAKVGEIVDTLDTEPVTTDEDGGYAIELDPDELSSRYFNGDFLNFDVGVVADDEYGFWGSTVWLKRKSYWRSDEQALIGDSVLDVSFDLDGPTITLTDSFGDAQVNTLPTMSAPPGAP